MTPVAFKGLIIFCSTSLWSLLHLLAVSTWVSLVSFWACCFSPCGHSSFWCLDVFTSSVGFVLDLGSSLLLSGFPFPCSHFVFWFGSRGSCFCPGNFVPCNALKPFSGLEARLVLLGSSLCCIGLLTVVGVFCPFWARLYAHTFGLCRPFGSGVLLFILLCLPTFFALWSGVRPPTSFTFVACLPTLLCSFRPSSCWHLLGFRWVAVVFALSAALL